MGRTRTDNRQFRRLMLCPIELPCLLYELSVGIEPTSREYKARILTIELRKLS